MGTPEEDSFAKNEREALTMSADNEYSPSRAYARAATFASSMAGYGLDPRIFSVA